MKNVLTLILLFVTTAFFSAVPSMHTAHAQAAWYNDAWSFRVKLTVDNAQVDADLTNFPVYVDLSDLPAGFHTNVNSDGGDIRVTTSDGETEVPREVVFYNSTTDTGELHFKGTLANSADTIFYIYYGNSGASDYATDAANGAENVWSNGYVGVWHLANGVTLSAGDSTQNDNDGTITTPSAATGKVDGAGSFNGSSDKIILARSASLNQTTSWTIEAWAYPTAAPQGAPLISEAYSGTEGSPTDTDVQYTIGFGMNEGPGGGSALKVGFYDGTWRLATDPAGNISTNAWVHAAGTWNGTTLTLYKNGASAASATPGGTVQEGQGKFFIGRRHDTAGSVNFFPGLIDEVRISSSVRVAEWVATEYNNQSSSDTFYTVGTQEEEGGEVPARILRLKGGVRLQGVRLF